MRPDTRPEYPPEYDNDDDPPLTWRARLAAVRQARRLYLYSRRASLYVDWRYWSATLAAGTTQDDPEYPRWYAGLHTARSLTGRRWVAWLGRRRWTHHSRRARRA